MSYKVKFPVGDWSGDGHRQCEWYICESNKPVEELREIHFKSKEVLGYDIGDICAYYQQSQLRVEIVKTIVERVGIEEFQDLIDVCLSEEDSAGIVAGKYDDHEIHLHVESIINIWVWSLKQIDPTLSLEICSEDDFPSINFYSFDNQDRHLETPGYGVLGG